MTEHSKLLTVYTLFGFLGISFEISAEFLVSVVTVAREAAAVFC